MVRLVRQIQCMSYMFHVVSIFFHTSCFVFHLVRLKHGLFFSRLPSLPCFSGHPAPHPLGEQLQYRLGDVLGGLAGRLRRLGKSNVGTTWKGVWLVVSNMTFIFHIWDVILPIDELIFFRGVETTNQVCVERSKVWIPQQTLCFLCLNSESHAKRASQFSWFYSESRRVAEAICHVQLQGLPNSALDHQGLSL